MQGYQSCSVSVGCSRLRVCGLCCVHFQRCSGASGFIVMTSKVGKKKRGDWLVNGSQDSAPMQGF